MSNPSYIPAVDAGGEEVWFDESGDVQLAGILGSVPPASWRRLYVRANLIDRDGDRWIWEDAGYVLERECLIDNDPDSLHYTRAQVEADYGPLTEVAA